MNVFAELKRRNVLRMTLLYLGAAWLVLQVVDVLIDRGPLPESLGPITLTVLTIGFPIALILSWFYEITPSGVTLDDDVEPGAALPVAGRRVDFIIIAVMGAAILMFAYDKWWTGPPPDQSVAVLPFVNMSDDAESAHLATGVAETILNNLAQVPDLHVAARTSSFQARLNGLRVKETADLLNVGTVLEGSVQRQGDRLRITAQLINAEDESHLWSRNFDREYGDIFVIQDEIAEAVASALELSLQGETQQRIDREGTDNLEAWAAYSAAMQNLHTRTTESQHKAVEQLQRAIELDPEFALAHAELGGAYLSARYWAWSDHTDEEVRALARKHAKIALRIAPGLSRGLLLLGNLTDDDDARGQLYLQAVENAPNDTVALRLYDTHLMFYESRVDESVALAEKALQLDPLDASNYAHLANRQLWNGNQNHAALETIARGLEKVPDSISLRLEGARAQYFLGEYRAAIELLYEILQIDPQSLFARRVIGLVYLAAGMPDAAEQWLESSVAHDPEAMREHELMGYREHEIKPLILDIYYQRNDEAVFTALRQLVAEQSGLDISFFCCASMFFVEYGARLGRLDEVLATLEKLYPELFAYPPDLEIDSFWEDVEPYHISGLALLQSGDVHRGGLLIQALREKWIEWDEKFFIETYSIDSLLAIGDTKAALERLRKWRKFTRQRGLNISLGHVIRFRHSRLFDPIRYEPEFVQMLADYDENAAEQRQLLQAMDLPVK